jgi:hypothetical protein
MLAIPLKKRTEPITYGGYFFARTQFARNPSSTTLSSDFYSLLLLWQSRDNKNKYARRGVDSKKEKINIRDLLFGGSRLWIFDSTFYKWTRENGYVAFWGLFSRQNV